MSWQESTLAAVAHVPSVASFCVWFAVCVSDFPRHDQLNRPATAISIRMKCKTPAAHEIYRHLWQRRAVPGMPKPTSWQPLRQPARPLAVRASLRLPSGLPPCVCVYRYMDIYIHIHTCMHIGIYKEPQVSLAQSCLVGVDSVLGGGSVVADRAQVKPVPVPVCLLSTDKN